MASAPRPHHCPPVGLIDLAALVGGRIDAAVSDGDGPSGRFVRVSGMTLRDAAVVPGDLFAALPGSSRHGAEFAAAAARAGAAAVVTDPAGLAIVRAAPDCDRLPVIVVDQPRALIGSMAAHIYGDPSRTIEVLGVTGTSGKTTTCFLVQAALAAAGGTAGLIGTVAARIGDEVLPSTLTTPEAPDLQALLAVMVERGVTAVAMEVSSHALAQGRVAGTEFAVGAFTNLSQDHLDYHHDMESYFAAKRLLFDGRSRREIVVIDDEYGRRLATTRPAAMTLSGVPGATADWTVSDRRETNGLQRFRLSGPAGIRAEPRIGLPGAFNITNAATAVAMTAAIGVDPTVSAAGLARVRVPGRMERIDRGQPFLAVVDYAHKPAALAAVLAAVREHAAGRIILVIGAGGDRDRAKRPLMGRVARDGADLVIVTDDNPRSEDPAAIRAAILAGMTATTGSEVREIADRREAIHAAIGAARPGDAVLVAGKGHELGQEIAGVVHPFSDRDVVAEALAARQGVTS